MTIEISPPVGRAIGRLERLTYERALRDREHAHERGLRFDDGAADHAVGFFERHIRHVEGEWAGRPFIPRPWQRFLLRQVFGWLRRYGSCPSCGSWLQTDPVDGTIECIACALGQRVAPTDTGWFRRFRRAYIEVGRKNGKSTVAAGVALYLTYADDEPGAQVYCSATKREQAMTAVFAPARQMVRYDPVLSLRGEVLRSNINVPSTGARFEPLGANSPTLDGLNVHGSIVDELHAHRDRTVWDVLVTAQGARRQPLNFVITTAGTYRPESIGWEMHDHAVKLLEGNIEDDSVFALVCAFDLEDDWTSPDTWQKANPNLGVSCKIESLADECRQAELSPAFRNTFLRLHGNVWTQQLTRWLDMERWNDAACRTPLPDLTGQPCWGGLDLATTTDLAALVLAFHDTADPALVWLVCRFWCPADRIVERSRRDLVPYDAWARDGWLTATPGDIIDYDAIKGDIAELARRYKIQELAFDRWNATQLVSQLGDEEGLTMVEFGQGWASMSSPSKELDRLVTGRLIRHGDHPVLRWMASNVAAKTDEAGNIKPDRKKSGEKIDGIVAAVMALGRMMVGSDATSVYEQRGLLSP